MPNAETGVQNVVRSVKPQDTKQCLLSTLIYRNTRIMDLCQLVNTIPKYHRTVFFLAFLIIKYPDNDGAIIFCFNTFLMGNGFPHTFVFLTVSPIFVKLNEK